MDQAYNPLWLQTKCHDINKAARHFSKKNHNFMTYEWKALIEHHQLTVHAGSRQILLLLISWSLVLPPHVCQMASPKVFLAVIEFIA